MSRFSFLGGRVASLELQRHGGADTLQRAGGLLLARELPARTRFEITGRRGRDVNASTRYEIGNEMSHASAAPTSVASVKRTSCIALAVYG
jgi:hypothetical protein